MDANYFTPGSFYLIVCLDGDEALKIQEHHASQYSGSRIINCAPNPDDNGQIFMVERVGKDDHYEIINCVSNLVLEDQFLSKEVKLHHGKQKESQLFKIEANTFDTDSQSFWIRIGKHGNKGLALEGVLRIEDHNPKSQNQLFRFIEVTNKFIQNSALIVNNLSGKAIEVPDTTREHGETIYQWKRTSRWNQRWHFEKHEEGMIIRNIYNGLCLNVSGEKNHSGAKVVQWEKNGAANQLWEPEYSGNGLFKFRSAINRQLCLAVKKQDIQDGGHLEISSENSDSMHWKILVERKEPYEENLILEIILIQEE